MAVPLCHAPSTPGRALVAFAAKAIWQTTQPQEFHLAKPLQFCMEQGMEIKKLCGQTPLYWGQFFDNSLQIPTLRDLR